MPKRRREENEEQKKSVVKRRRIRPIIDSSDDEEIVTHEDNNLRARSRRNAPVQVHHEVEVRVPAPEPLDVPMPEVLDDDIHPFYDEPLDEQPPVDIEHSYLQAPPPPPVDTEQVVESLDDSSAANPEIDPELLKALGDYEDEVLEWGENLHEDIAKRFQQILLNGLKKEAKEELQKKFLFPKNVSFVKAPTLNPEISTMLTEACKNRDKRIQAKQDQLGKALSALGKAMTALLKKNPDIPNTLRLLNDAGKLVANSHYAETDTRRALVIPLVDKSLIEPFKDRKRDSLLFGEKLGELVTNSRGIKRTSQYIQAPSTYASGSGLNWRGPSSRGRQLRGSQFYPGRAGGQRYQYVSRRRAAPPTLPQAARRTAAAPPPPPPPARRQPQPQPSRAPPPGRPNN